MQQETAGLLAEKEIIKRLIKSLINESNDLNDSVFWKDLRTNINYYRIPNTKNLLLVSLNYSDQIDTNNKPVVEIDSEGNFKDISFIKLLNFILDIWDIPTERRQVIVNEVTNSYENMKTIFDWENENIEQILAEIDSISVCNTCRERNNGLCISESLPFKGHPIHVCTKTKVGLSSDELLKYSPEFFNKVPLHLLAISSDYVKQYGDNSSWITFLKNELSIQINSDEIIIPVHPWHFEHVVKKEFKAELESGIIRIVEQKIHAMPTLSFRTLALCSKNENDLGMHVKVPVGIQVTSVFRLLSKRDIYNGIVFSEKLKELSNQLIAVKNKLGVIVPDLYGVHFKENVEKTNKQGPLLSFMLRENPVLMSKPNEKIIVASSLIHKTPIINKPLLVQFHQTSKIDIKLYVFELFKVFLYLPLEIFLKLGIAIDSHGQNCIIKFDSKGMPITLIYRDLGSVQIVEGTSFAIDNEKCLIDAHKTILPYQDCIDEFFHSLYYNLIVSFIEVISSHYKISDSALWEIAKQVSIEIIDSVECEKESKFQLYNALLSKTMPIKSLLRMRLEDKTIFSRIPNPLLS
ncbi:IucA/IucC family protein [Flavobacterium psychrophilum]|uniref:IucA/IucC family protein n=1 Tax=Flavobacterium psychrophilum TaxID=96345 RepID=UPI00106C6FEC|nr:IucA/IucC family siderophore biosynthesis protein [Flavobacterium psychrophilum]